MKKIIVTMLATSAVLLNSCDNIKKKMKNLNDQTKSVIFAFGDKASADYFIGTAHAAAIVPNDTTFECPVYNVTFEPSARNNWHKHPGGQLLLCTGGEGYYQERGKDAILLKEGDVVKIAPNIEHWHGATSESLFTHIAICPNIEKGDAEWLEPVSEEYYNNIKK